MDHTEYLRRVKSYIKTPTKEVEEQLDAFCEACTYISGQYDQDEPFKQLDKHILEIESNRKEGNRVFYMALPPSVFITVSQHLKRNCYPKDGIARVIVGAQNPSMGSQLTLRRSRNPSAKTSGARESCRRHWSLTGQRSRSSVSTTTLARRWSKTC